MDFKKIVGKRLKEYRKAKGLSQKNLAKATNGAISPNYISQIENGLHFPSLKILIKLADVLEVPPDKFLIGDKDTFEFFNISHNKIKNILGENGYALFLSNLHLLDERTKTVIIEFLYAHLKHENSQ